MIENYEAIVNRPGEVDQHDLVSRVLAEDFRFVGPTVGVVAGGEAMLEAMEALHERAPAERVHMRRTTPIDAHNGWFRFGWEFVDQDGEFINSGINVGRLSESGKLSLVVAFFGHLG